MFITLAYEFLAQLMKVKGETQKNIYSMLFLQKERIKAISKEKNTMMAALRAGLNKKVMDDKNMSNPVRVSLMEKFSISQKVNLQDSEAN